MRQLNRTTYQIRRFAAWAWTRVGHCFDDTTYLKVRFRLLMNKRLNLTDPRSFNEKLQWLKLNNRRSEYTKLVDKYAVKDYVAKRIGPEYVIPTLFVWDRVEDINWRELPNKFVLKTTHGGGSLGVVVCKDKEVFNVRGAVSKLKKSLRTDGYKVQLEWPYKDVPRRIIAEELIESKIDSNDLPDYKFFCFNGKVQGLFVATDRNNPKEEVKFDFFDAEYNHLPFRQGHDNAQITPAKPKNFELMKNLAEKLSEGIPHVRVDLYDTGDKVYFGEMTFYHFGGFVPFEPEEWDCRIGDLLTLP